MSERPPQQESVDHDEQPRDGTVRIFIEKPGVGEEGEDPLEVMREAQIALEREMERQEEERVSVALEELEADMANEPFIDTPKDGTTKKGGTGGGLSTPVTSSAPLGMPGPGIGWSDTRVRGVSRSVYNFLDRQLRHVDGVLKYVIGVVARMSFNWLPGSRPDDPDKNQAIKSYTDEEK